METQNIPTEGNAGKTKKSCRKNVKKYFFYGSCFFTGSLFFGMAGAFLFSVVVGHVPKLESWIQSKGIFSEGVKNTRENVSLKNLSDEEDATISVVKKVTPAVVSIVVKKDVSLYRKNPFDFFFDPFGSSGSSESSGTAPEMQKQQIGGGTGFFVTAEGIVVTNKHVVSDTAAEYTVITQDGKEYPATVLARDPSRDVAMIKVMGENFPTLELGDSDSLSVGQTVIAIGNSLGEFSNSVSRGIVSGLKRDIVAGSGRGNIAAEHLTDIIQTDAAINPGNSGGPLLDITGLVIGMNTAVAQGAQNIGFALPINSIKKSVDQVKETGEITTPFLGIRYALLNKEIQVQNSLPYSYGALVLRGEIRTDLAVIPGSPADKSGIVENDIILEIDGKKITEENDLSQMVSGYSVGDTLSLKIWHKGEEKTVSVQLEKRGVVGK